MKINNTVKSALDGISSDGSIYARFLVPPVSEINVRPNVIFKLCAEKRVIHLGCTDHLPLIDDKLKHGTYLHRQLSYVTAECIGVDINEEAINYVRSKGIANVVAGDMTKPGISEVEALHWDYLLIPDVIEHIPNPAAFLQGISESYGKYIDRIIITTPNAFGNYLYGEAAFRQETVNYDHCFWFTPYTLCKVVHAAGLELDELIMCSYENPATVLRPIEAKLKEYPMLSNTLVLTARFKK